MINADLIGAEGLKQDLARYGVRAERAIDLAVFQTAAAIEKTAKQRLRGMLGSTKHWITGRLASSIYNRKIQSMEKVVGTDVEYAPYIEFGTGDVVFENFDFDENAKQVASQYKGAGIRKVNIKGDSFLNYAAVNQQEKLVERIETEMNKIR